MVPRIQPDELHELARSWGFAVDAADEADLLAISEGILPAFDALEAQPAARAEPLAAVRDPGREAKAGEDPLNAIVRFCRVRAEGAEGVLSGKRLGTKDCVAIAGIPMTCGSRILQGYVPAEDSVVGERILRGGGEIAAITNMDDLAFSGGGDSSCYGATLNPWDESRTAGGSSGGSAAALFYDGFDACVGGDQGGSIRVPASWCGVVGLKPTHSLVPYVGIPGIDQGIDHCGPLARTAADAAALLDAIAGAHPWDPRQREVPVADYSAAVGAAADNLRAIRIGVVAEGFDAANGVEPATADAVRDCVERLRGLGAEPVDLRVPAHLQSGGIAFAYFVEGMASLMEAGGNGFGWTGRYREDLAGAVHDGMARRAQELSPQVKIALLAGLFLRRRYGGALYAKAQNLRQWLQEAHDTALAEVDVLLLPTTPWRAHEVAPELPAAERVLRGWANLANTYPTNVTGHPAISLPLAAAEGLPVGVMLVGRRFEDDRLLAIAATCERALGWAPQR